MNHFHKLSLWLRRRRRTCFAAAGIAGLLVLTAFTFVHSRSVPFKPLPTEPEPALQWVFVTPNGEGSPSYQALFPTQEECAQLAGMPVELTFCTMEKFLNMNTAGLPVDLVTCWYTDSSFKRLETGGEFWPLQDLLDQQVPGFSLPKDFVLWCGNLLGKVYAYPHTDTVLSPEEPKQADTVLIARRDLLEKFHWERTDFEKKESVLEQLKTIRKTSPELTPCYLELSSLQQMFGASPVSGGEWEDPFFHPATLEALEYMNTLYRERLLSPDVFTLSVDTLLSQLEEGELFLASSSGLGRLLAQLPENHPILKQYEAISPIRSDSGREPAFANNFDEQYPSTLFLKDSPHPQAQARLLAGFYLQNMELSLQQEEALRAAGLKTLLDQQPKPQPASPEEPYVVPIVHYEILFSHYSNTRLAAVAERKTAYCQTQVVRLVEDCSPEEVEPEYNQIVQALQSGEYRLLLDWKQTRYQKALDLLEEPQLEFQPPEGETLSEGF